MLFRISIKKCNSLLTNKASPKDAINFGNITENKIRIHLLHFVKLPLRYYTYLQGIIMSGDFVIGGLKTFLAFSIKGSSFSPKFSIVMPKAQRAITSIVKALNSLEKCIKNRTFKPYGSICNTL